MMFWLLVTFSADGELVLTPSFTLWLLDDGKVVVMCAVFVIFAFHNQTLQHKHLIIRVSSYIWITKSGEVGLEVVFQALSSSWERHSTDEEHKEHQVGKCSSEVHHLQTYKRRL